MTSLNPRAVLRRALLSRHAVYEAAAPDAEQPSHATRLLHLLLALCVVQQLASSQFMSAPMPGDPPSLLFALHEYVGIGSFALVLLFWIWTLVRHGETKIGRLFPWLSPRALRAVLRDAVSQIVNMLRLAPLAESDGAFASAVHGLGLLALTAMAGTGTAYFVWSASGFGDTALNLHRAIANLMWIYLFGHAGIAALHHLLGHDILRRMFWITRGRTEAPDLRPDLASAPHASEGFVAER